MGYTVTHRDGRMEQDPPLTRLRELAAELQLDDVEHPDIAVAHESGWSLSVDTAGTATLENLEVLETPPVVGSLPLDEIETVLSDLAVGDVRSVAKRLEPGA